MNRDLSRLIDELPDFQEKARGLSEILLSNLVMLSEIPAPTFGEDRRMAFLTERFNEYELLNCSTDEAGNALGIIPGAVGNRNILVVAHLDTIFSEEIDHTVTIEPDTVSGAGIGDDSLGLAAIATLPIVLKHLQIEPNANIVLMGSARSLGRGDLEGIRFFLKNRGIPIDTGICVEGVKLGRLSASSIGMLRAEMEYAVPEEYDWTRFGASGAILSLNDAINRILEIPLPRRPQTSIVLNRLESGAAFNTIPRQAELQLEIRSESGELVRKLGEQIQDIGAEISSKTGSEVTFTVLARREPGGIPFAHPLASTARDILKALGVRPRISPSTSELSAFIDHGIPAVTIGLTEGENHSSPEERLEIAPIFVGIAQLLGLLRAIDGGLTSES